MPQVRDRVMEVVVGSLQVLLPGHLVQALVDCGEGTVLPLMDFLQLGMWGMHRPAKKKELDA